MSTPARRAARRSLVGAAALWVAGAVPGAAAAYGASDSVINVAVNVPPGSFPPAPLQVSTPEAAQNYDVQNQDTTVKTYTGYQGQPGKSATSVIYTPIIGMSLARLARLAQVSPLDLVSGPGPAVTLTDRQGGGGEMTLSKQEVISGFDDPCMSASTPCIPGNPPDTNPNFAVIEATEEGIVVQRPLRSFSDFNGDNQLQTPFGGPLTVTFNTVGDVLDVNSPAESASTITVGDAVSFTAPTSVYLNGSPDPNTPLTYTWEFGDGTTGTGTSPTHVYTAPGHQSVLVTVTDARQHSGTGEQLFVQVDAKPGAPPPPPAFIPAPPPRLPTPKPKAPAPVPPVQPASSPPTSTAMVIPGPPHSSAAPPRSPSASSPTLHLSSGDGGSGSGTGSGNGQGAGAGSGAKTGVSGGSGTSAQGVAVGGAATNGSPTGQIGAKATRLPGARENGLVGVLVDPSGSGPLSEALSSAASRAAAAARALAGGHRSRPIGWLGWLLGVGAVVAVMSARALHECELRASYRSHRIR